MQIHFGSQPVHLFGSSLQVGMKMPRFTLTDHTLSDVSSDTLKRPLLLLSFPSVDTSICSLVLLTFNDLLESHPHLHVYSVTMDLPFTQERWVRKNAGDYITMLSDHKFRDFGEATGTFVEELGFLAQAAFVVDMEDTLTYAEYQEEVGSEPNYDTILKAALDVSKR